MGVPGSGGGEGTEKQLTTGVQLRVMSPRLGEWALPAGLWGDGSFPSSASWHSMQRTAFPQVVRARLSANSLGIVSQLPGARRRQGGGRGGDAGWGERMTASHPSAADRLLKGEGWVQSRAC